jgi:hypothetical protein
MKDARLAEGKQMRMTTLAGKGRFQFYEPAFTLLMYAFNTFPGASGTRLQFWFQDVSDLIPDFSAKLAAANFP